MHVASFTWEEFVWATSVAMTRQNVLPLQQGTLNYVLIPAWDMCNHDVGEVRCVFAIFIPSPPYTLFYPDYNFL